MCSGPCYKAWDDAGRPRPEHDICQCCGDKHKVLFCNYITPEKKEQMIREIGYVHEWSWWHNVNNIAKARNLLFGQVQPQHMMHGRRTTDYAHADALVGMIIRRAYFDLGGQYDIMDEAAYDPLVKQIEQGLLPGSPAGC